MYRPIPYVYCIILLHILLLHSCWISIFRTLRCLLVRVYAYCDTEYVCVYLRGCHLNIYSLNHSSKYGMTRKRWDAVNLNSVNNEPTGKIPMYTVNVGLIKAHFFKSTLTTTATATIPIAIKTVLPVYDNRPGHFSYMPF